MIPHITADTSTDHLTVERASPCDISVQDAQPFFEHHVTLTETPGAASCNDDGVTLSAVDTERVYMESVQEASRILAILETTAESQRGEELIQLANGYTSRLDATESNLARVNAHILIVGQGVLIISDDDPLKPVLLRELGHIYSVRFERLDELEDVNKAIDCKRQAITLTPDDDVNKPIILNNLGNLYQSRFKRLGNHSDIDSAVETLARAFIITPEEHPDRLAWLSNLGDAHLCRFECLGHLADISSAIDYLNQALPLTAENHKSRFSVLICLGDAYLRRFLCLEKLEDINGAIDYLNKAVVIAPDEYPNTFAVLSNLGSAYRDRFVHSGELADINRAIELLSEATSLIPKGHTEEATLLNNLGMAYQNRFDFLGRIADIDSAIDFKNRAVLITPKQHTDRLLWLNSLGNSYEARFERLGEVSDIEKALDYKSHVVSLTPDEDADKPRRLRNLGCLYRTQFERLSKSSDIEKAIECMSQGLSLTSEGGMEKPRMLSMLGVMHHTRFECLGELVDIQKAIDYARQGVELTLEGHSDRPHMLNNLGISYQSRFLALKNAEDNTKSIEFLTLAVSLIPEGHAGKPDILFNLGKSYHKRPIDALNHPDYGQHKGYFKKAALSTAGHPLTRLNAARKWLSASSFDCANIVEASETIMTLIPQIILLGATVNRRYENVSDIGEAVVQAAAYLITEEQYYLALECLEEGRSIVWNQTLQLRTPLHDLSLIDAALADKLEHTAHKLNHAGLVDPLEATLSLNGPSIEQTAREHHRLAAEWDKLVDEARRLPGCHDFLRRKGIVELIQAARPNTIVMINVHNVFGDAVALLPGSTSFVHIYLYSLSYKRALNLRNRLIDSLQGVDMRAPSERRPMFDEIDETSQLEAVLAELWDVIVEPVLDGLGYLRPLSTDDLPHLTWCATGPLSALPLHAAGRYDDPYARAFNYVVSSYTPTLNALLKPPRPVKEFRGILAVGQASSSSYGSLPGTVAELDRIQEKVGNLHFTRLEEDKATSAAVLAAMKEHSWVHLACHASQNASRPTASAFHLHGSQIDLATITREQLSGGELAFLSACQTATGDEKLPDEAVHLAAGMIMSGYSTVIATMWSIKDEDAPLVADKFYSHLLHGGVPDGKKAAIALHNAVGYLRTKVGEKAFSRWVPYIHMGQ